MLTFWNFVRTQLPLSDYGLWITRWVDLYMNTGTSNLEWLVRSDAHGFSSFVVFNNSLKFGIFCPHCLDSVKLSNHLVSFICILGFPQAPDYSLLNYESDSWIVLAAAESWTLYRFLVELCCKQHHHLQVISPFALGYTHYPFNALCKD